MTNPYHAIRSITARNYKKLYQRTKGFSLGSGKLVLVPGVQRSGTNMIMDVLERNRYTDVYHETDLRAFENYSLREIAQIRSLHGQSRAPFFVLKALQDSHRVAEIRSNFSESAILWPYRDYRDMVNSHIVSWPGGREHIDEIVKGQQLDNWRSRGLTEEIRKEMREVYREDLNTESCVALFWYMRNSLFFSQRLYSDSSVLLVKYESLVSDPAVGFEAICRHITLPYEPKMHTIVHARSLRKNSAPPIDAAIAEICDGLQTRLDKLTTNQQ